MTIAELLGAAGTLAGVGGVITFGVFAWRGRGEAIAATRRELEAGKKLLEAERKADELGRAKLDADAIAAAANTELAATKEELERVREVLISERVKTGNLYEKLAALGAPVGDVVVDSAIDGLFPDANDRKADPR